MASTTTGTEKVPSAIPSTSSSASALGTARETAGEGGRNPKMMASEFHAAVRTSLNDQPMTTIAAVVGIGFVLGAIWKK